jgi:hypothetical protein
MSDLPGVASYAWKNNLAWLAKVSVRGELARWINYSSSNWLPVLNNFQTYSSGMVIFYNKFLVNKMSKNRRRKKQVTYA